MGFGTPRSFPRKGPSYVQSGPRWSRLVRKAASDRHATCGPKAVSVQVGEASWCLQRPMRRFLSAGFQRYNRNTRWHWIAVAFDMATWTGTKTFFSFQNKTKQRSCWYETLFVFLDSTLLYRKYRFLNAFNSTFILINTEYESPNTKKVTILVLLRNSRGLLCTKHVIWNGRLERRHSTTLDIL